MNHSHPKWIDVVEVVERANLEAARDLKERERMINQEYVRDAGEQISRNKQEVSLRRAEQLQERLRMEEEARLELNLKKITKQMKMKRQKEYNKNNLEIIQTHKGGARKESVYPEHPFVRLVDEQEKRRQNFRENLRRQNEMNQLQEKIKLKELNEKKLIQKQQRDRYINHVEAYYLKKLEDRNVFKTKYLKLTNPEKSQMLQNQGGSLSNTIEKEYSSLNESMMDIERKTSKLRDTEIDRAIYHINKRIEVPDSSPAFLGRIPISSDRRRQLEYLQRSAYKRNERRRLKTQGNDMKQPQSRRFTTQTQELPVLSQYYYKLSEKTMQKQDEQRFKSPQINSCKTEIHQIRNVPNQYKSKVERGSNDKSTMTQSEQRQIEQKKVFSTYDIIQNKRKYLLY